MQPLRDTIGKHVVIQVAGYAGVTAALVGAVALLGQSAADEIVVFLVFAAVTAVLAGGGFVIARTPIETYQWMRSVLWFGAVFSFGGTLQALTLGVLEIGAEGGDTAETVMVLTGAATAVAAWLLWRLLRRTLQLVALNATLAGTLFSIVIVSADPFSGPDPGVLALVLWLFGAAWTVPAGRGGLEPVGPALVLGALTAVTAPYVAAAPGGGGPGVAIGLCGLWSFLTAIPYLGLGALRRSGGVQVVAIAALLAGAGALTGDLVGTELSALAALAVGAVLLAGSLVAIRQRPPASVVSPATPPPPPPTA